MENMLKFGPKEMKGSMWDERGKSEIVQIMLSYSESEIKSIQFSYVLNGKVCRSEIHGEPSGPKFSMVTFDYPSEFLISVSGEDQVEHEGIYKLASLVFGTNKGTYGPFGRTGKIMSVYRYRKFSYDFGPNRCFGGFYGSNRNGFGGCVNAIGVYVKPIDSLSQLKHR